MSKKFSDLYKRRSAGFNVRRLVRAGRQEERRRENRDEEFARNRDVPTGTRENRRGGRSNLSARLQRWKEERALKKKIEAENRKPIFKVGIVCHGFSYSPVRDAITTRRRQPTGGEKKKKEEKKNMESAASIVPSTDAVFDQSFAPPYYNFTAPKAISVIPEYQSRISSNFLELAVKAALAKPWRTEFSTNFSFRLSSESESSGEAAANPGEYISGLVQEFLGAAPSKKVTSPLAVIKVSKTFKTPEVTMDDTMSAAEVDDFDADTQMAESAAFEAARPEASKIPSIIVIDATPTKTSTKGEPSNRYNTLDAPAVALDEEPFQTRLLRSRIVISRIGEINERCQKRRTISTVALETPRSGTPKMTRSYVATEKYTRSSKAKNKENAKPQKKINKIQS